MATPSGRNANDFGTSGRHVITLDFNYDGGVGKGGEATLAVDGNKVANKKLPRTIAYRMSLDETLDIGEDTGTPVSEDYQGAAEK